MPTNLAEKPRLVRGGVSEPEKERRAGGERQDDDGRKRRVAIEFSAEAYDRLNQLREASGSPSSAEVIRDALRVYDFLLQNRKNGWAIHLVKDKSVKELELLPLL